MLTSLAALHRPSSASCGRISRSARSCSPSADVLAFQYGYGSNHRPRRSIAAMSRSPGFASKLVRRRGPGPAKDRGGKMIDLAPGVGVPAHDRDAIAHRCVVHAFPDPGGALAAGGPDRIDNRDRASAHRINVAQIHHHRAIPREAGFGGNKLIEQAFNCQKKMPVVVWDGCTVIAVADGRMRREQAHGVPDVEFVLHPAQVAKVLGQHRNWGFGRSGPRRFRPLSQYSGRGLG